MGKLNQILKPMSGPDYDTDYAGWADHQAELLRRAQFDGLDIANLVEELEDVSKSELRGLSSALTIVLLHMLKWDYQPSRRSRSWAGSIRVQRKHIANTLKDSPSLTPKVSVMVERAYDIAIDEANTETGLPLATFPADCPYDWDMIMTRSHDLTS